MDFYKRREWYIIHALLFISGAFLFFFYLAGFYEFGEPAYFWDSSIRWRMVGDLIENGFTDFSVIYPARDLDPGMEFFPADYMSKLGDKGYSWFSPYTSFLFAPFYYIPGGFGPALLQQLLHLGILYLMVLIGGRLRLPFYFLIGSLLLFRFGTAQVFMLADIESHTVAAFFLLLGIYLGAFHESKSPPSFRGLKGESRTPFSGLSLLGGVFAGLAFAFRPETLVAIIILPLLIYFFSPTGIPGKDADEELKVMRRRRAQTVLRGSLFSLLIIMYANLSLYENFLGVKAALDPAHDLPDAWLAHLLNMPRVLFFDSLFISNGFFFQAPLAFAAIYTLFRSPEEERETFLYMRLAGGFFICLPALAFLTPASLGGPYIGFRFAYFLYPLMILLALKHISLSLKTNNFRFPKRLGYSVLYLWSIILSFAFMAVSNVVYKDYYRIYTGLKKTNSSVLIVRDTYITAALYDEFYRRPTLLIKEGSKIAPMIKKLKAAGYKNVDLAGFYIPPLAGAPEVRKKYAPNADMSTSRTPKLNSIRLDLREL